MLSFMLSLTTLWAQGKNERKCAFPTDDFYFRSAMADFAYMHEGPARDREIRTFTAANCLNTAQTRRLAALYSNEYRRYDYVIYAADFVIDYPKYMTMSDLFRNPQLRQQLMIDLGYEPAIFVCNIPGYTGRIGGPRFVSDMEFSNVYEMMRRESFDNRRLDIFRAAAGERLFTAAQIVTMAELYSFDSHRLSFAKAALANCFDLDNFFMVNATFSFDSYKRDLNNYFRNNVHRFVWERPANSWGLVPQYAPHTYLVAGYTGRVGYENPTSGAEFNGILNHLNHIVFDNERLELLKTATGARGFTAAQVAALAELFDFDGARYDFASWSLDKTYDIDNFYIVASTFDFNNYETEFLSLIV